MAARRKRALWILASLLTAAAGWLLWPQPAGGPRPATQTQTHPVEERTDRGLAPAPPRAPPRPDEASGPHEASTERAAVPAPAVIDGGILEGEVKDAEGLPAVGVVVTALAPDEPLPPRRRGHMWYVSEEDIARAKARQPSAVSDAAGRYAIRGVPLGTEVTAAVHVSDRLDGRSTPVTFSRSGERQQRDVVLPLAGHLDVRVVGWRAGATRIEQITVLGPTGWLDSFGETALVEGEWRVDGLRPGPYAVQIFPHDAPGETRTVEVLPGRRTLVEIGLPTGRQLDGVVVTETGEPIAGAHVWWIGADTIMGRSDDDGRFHLEGIHEPVGTLHIEATRAAPRRPLTAREARVIEGVAAGGAPVRIVLPPAPRLLARVIGLAPSTPVESTLLSRSINAHESARPLGDGRIDVPLTHPRDPTMWVLTTPGFAPLVVDVVGPYPTGTRDLGDLRFDRGRTVAGEVRDASGRAVAGATVLVTERWIQAKQETAADGTFRFELMPIRATEVRVDAPGYPVHIVTLPAGRAGEQARITLMPGGTLSIRVLDAEGAAVPGANVTFMPDGPRPYDVDYDKTGRSRAADAQGFLEARLQARGHRIVAYDTERKRKGLVESVVVEEGASTSLEIRVR